MIKFSAPLRAIVLLKRIAQALEERNKIERHRLELEHPQLTQRSQPKLREVFTASIEERNEAWRENQQY
jgi:hypothetical protein